MFNFLVATFLLFSGFGGAAIHLRATIATGQFVGTKREFDFVFGAFLAIFCLPAGTVMLFA